MSVASVAPCEGPNVLPVACWQAAFRRQLAGSWFRLNETVAQPFLKAYQRIVVSNR